MSVKQYTAYGVKIMSSQPLPLEPIDQGDFDHSVSLVFQSEWQSRHGEFPYIAPGAQMHGREVILSSNMPMDAPRRVPQRRWKLSVGEVLMLCWDHQSDIIEVQGEQVTNLAMVAFWVLHTTIPVYMMLKQGGLFLHASGVEIHNKATLFLAPSYGGKSTTASYFLNRGHALVADDKIRVVRAANGFKVYPSHPYSRTARAFETLGEYTEQHSRQALEIRALFVLEYVLPGDDVQVSEVTGLEKFETLKQAYLYEPTSLVEQEIKEVLNMAQQLPLYRAAIPKGLQRLPEVYDEILGCTQQSA